MEYKNEVTLRSLFEHPHLLHIEKYEEQPGCPICFVPFEPRSEDRDRDGEVLVLECGHVFHLSCMKNLARVNMGDPLIEMRCPLCRYELNAAEMGEVDYKKPASPEEPWEGNWPGPIQLRAAGRDYPHPILSRLSLEQIVGTRRYHIYWSGYDADFLAVIDRHLDEKQIEFAVAAMNGLMVQFENNESHVEFFNAWRNAEQALNASEGEADWYYPNPSNLFTMEGISTKRSDRTWSFVNGFGSGGPGTLFFRPPEFTDATYNMSYIQKLLYLWGKGLGQNQQQEQILLDILVKGRMWNRMGTTPPLWLKGLPILNPGDGEGNGEAKRLLGLPPQIATSKMLAEFLSLIGDEDEYTPKWIEWTSTAEQLVNAIWLDQLGERPILSDQDGDTF